MKVYKVNNNLLLFENETNCLQSRFIMIFFIGIAFSLS